MATEPDTPGTDEFEVWDARFPDRFFIVHSKLVRDGYLPAIGDAATKVYISLVDHANQDHAAYPSQPRIAKQVGLSERTVRRAVDVLAEFGLIEVIPPHGSRRNNVYRLTTPDDWRPVEGVISDRASTIDPDMGVRDPKVLTRTWVSGKVDVSCLSPTSINTDADLFSEKERVGDPKIEGPTPEKKDGRTSTGTARPPTALWAFWEAFCAGAAIDPKAQSLMKAQLSVAKALMAEGITNEQIKACGAAMRKQYRPVLTMQYARGFLPGFLADYSRRATTPDEQTLLRWYDFSQANGKYPPDALDYFRARWGWDRPNQNHPEFIDLIRTPTARLVNARGEARIAARRGGPPS